MAKYILIILLLLSIGCTRKVYVPIHTSVHQTDTLQHLLTDLRQLTQTRTATERQTHLLRQTETTTLNDRGDTIRHDTHSEITTAHYSTLQKENSLLLARIDSLTHLRAHRDSIPYPVEVKVPYPVDRPLTLWQRITQTTGTLTLLLLLPAALLYYRRHKKSN